MADPYFKMFPTIYYNGLLCRDLSRRVTINPNYLNNPHVFYPLTLKDGLRADNLAKAYYDDSELDWILLLSNKIIDPFYGWFVEDNDFREYIIEKYDGVEWPQKHVAFYRNNWYSDNNEISSSHYESLSSEIKKFYSPIYGVGNDIIRWKRKQIDWTMNTNIIRRYSIDVPSDKTFKKGEIVDFHHAGQIVGTAEVIMANSSSVDIMHFSGNTFANTSWIKEIVGEESGVIANTDTIIMEHYNISNSESAFWEPVSYYDLEVERNESLRHIYVIDDMSVGDIIKDVEEKLNSE